jgi:hypothetical protein
MTDIVFENAEQVTVLCNNLNVRGHDLLLDSASRRRPIGPLFRRALVHDENDGLTVNFAGDYPGGVTINGVRSLDVTGDLQFVISHHDTALLSGGHPPGEKVILSDVIKDLRGEIASLKAQLALLGTK